MNIVDEFARFIADYIGMFIYWGVRIVVYYLLVCFGVYIISKILLLIPLWPASFKGHLVEAAEFRNIHLNGFLIIPIASWIFIALLVIKLLMLWAG